MPGKPGSCKRVTMEELVIEGNITYSLPGVIVQSPKEDQLHSGLLKITETSHGVFITWDKDTEVQQGLSVTTTSNGEGYHS